MNNESKIKNVVADAGAFIRNAPLGRIGDNVFCIPEVIQEIRDKATLQRLQVLPYTIKYKQPSPEAIKFVTDFSKKTGDYRSLSAVDIKVMALTYDLEKQCCGTGHIKTAPERKVEWNTTRKNLEKPTDIAGFYLGSNKPKSKPGTRSTSECSATDGSSDLVVSRSQEVEDRTETNDDSQSPELRCEDSEKCQNEVISEDAPLEKEENSLEPCDKPTQDSGDIEVREGKGKYLVEGDIIPVGALEGEEEESSDEAEEDEDDDEDEGWITPSNLKDITRKMDDTVSDCVNIDVGCLTTDFAVQNVLIQMGLNVVSVDGMLIKKAKSYILRCHACFKITTNITKHFCPSCGNETLDRVSMTVQDDGSIRYFLSRRKPVSSKGLNYSLPLPKGGKHAQNPITAEDMPLPQQRASKKAKQKVDIMNMDFVEGMSPFAMKDVTSRAAQLGIHANRDFNKRNQPGGKTRKKRK